MYASNSYYGNYLGEWLETGRALSPVSGNFPVSWVFFFQQHLFKQISQ